MLVLTRFVRRLVHALRYRVSAWFKPRMVLGWRRADGVYLPRTRISNVTHIDHPHQLDLADNVYIGHFNLIEASGGLSIGEGCQITNYVSVVTHSSHVSLRLYGAAYCDFQDHIAYRRGAIAIGAYSFIGPHTVIMPGSKIGKGSVVAAYSYVDGTFPDFAILAGNPAVAVGDTRQADAVWLADHPELHAYYIAWAGVQAKASD